VQNKKSKHEDLFKKRLKNQYKFVFSSNLLYKLIYAIHTDKILEMDDFKNRYKFNVIIIWNNKTGH